MGELGNWKSGGTPSRSNTKYFSGSIPWYSSGELNTLYISDSKEKISEEAVQASNASIIKVNSLLLGMYDTAALKSSITTIPATCNQAIAFANVDNRIDVLYVYYAIQIAKEEFRKYQRGVRQKNLNLSMVKNIKIPLPTEAKQKQFRGYHDSISNNIKKQTSALGELDNLFNALMQKAFKGELQFAEAESSFEQLEMVF